MVIDLNYSNPPTYVFCSQTQFTKQSARLRKYDAEHVFEFLNSHNQEITLGDLLEIRNQGALKEPRNPSPRLRRGQWQFRSWLRCLDWLNVESRYYKTLIRKSGKQQQLGKELREYLLKSDSEAEQTFSVSPDFAAWFLQVAFVDSCISKCRLLMDMDTTI